MAGFEIGHQRAAIANVAKLVSASRTAGVAVFWSVQEHLEEDRTRGRHKLPTHIDKGADISRVRGTWDAEIVDELKTLLRDEDIVFAKHRASCFFDMVLASDLRMRGIVTLVICGTATNYCVDATIRDAYARDLDLIVVEDGCGCAFPDLHAMKNVDLFHGVMVRTEELVSALASESGMPSPARRAN